MHSIIVSGGNKKSREEKLKQLKSEIFTSNNPDLLLIKRDLQKKSIGIGDVRSVGNFLIKKPIKHKENIVLIENADLMTLEAQNSLLKTLEEPPPNSQIILETQNENKLLSTILSRCQKISVKGSILAYTPEHRQAAEEFIRLLNSNQGEKLDYVESAKTKLADRDFALNLIYTWQSVLRDNLLLKSGGDKRKIINKLDAKNVDELIPNATKTITLLEDLQKLKEETESTNSNIRLGLELFLLQI